MCHQYELTISATFSHLSARLDNVTFFFICFVKKISQNIPKMESGYSRKLEQVPCFLNSESPANCHLPENYLAVDIITNTLLFFNCDSKFSPLQFRHLNFTILHRSIFQQQYSFTKSPARPPFPCNQTNRPADG